MIDKIVVFTAIGILYIGYFIIGALMLFGTPTISPGSVENANISIAFAAGIVAILSYTPVGIYLTMIITHKDNVKTV